MKMFFNINKENKKENKKENEKKETRFFSFSFFKKNKNVLSPDMKESMSPRLQETPLRETIKEKIRQSYVFLSDHFNLLVKSAAQNHLRIQECKKVQAGQACNLEFESFTQLKKYQKKVRLFTYSFSSTLASALIVLVVAQVFFIGKSQGKDFTWTQDDWLMTKSGAKANHDSDQTGFKDYESKDAGIAISDANLIPTSGKDVQLASKTDVATQTTDVDFNAGTQSNTVVGGTASAGNVSIKKDFVSISIGNAHTLGLKSNGTLWAWGINSTGEFGLGYMDVAAHPFPVVIPSMTNVIAIATGGNHSLALKSDGTLWAWGSNIKGQLGNNSTIDSYSPIQIMTGVSSIAASDLHSLAIKSDGTVWGWGRNYSGELGDGTYTQRNLPVQVLTGGKIVSTNTYNTAVLKTDGTVWTWGNANNNGQLGDGLNVRITPAQITKVNVGDSCSGTLCTVVGTVIDISSGFAGINIALKSDGTLWTWGAGSRVGDGTATMRPSPVQITRISAGDSCASGSGGTCTTTGKIISISAGNGYSFAVDAGGMVWAWGTNTGGQFGDGTVVNNTAPAKNMGLNSVVSVSLMNQNATAYSIFLKSDGTILKTNAAGTVSNVLDNLGGYFNVGIPYSPAVFTSSSVDLGSKTRDYDLANNKGIRISWGQILNNGTVGILVSTSLDGTNWTNFKGTDGSDQADCAAGKCYTNAATATLLNSVHNGARFVKYKAFLTSVDQLNTPTLNDVTFSYDHFYAKNVIANYHLDGTVGNIANGTAVSDFSGNSNGGTTSNANSTGLAYQTGKIGQAMNFDGVDDYVSIPASSSLNLSTNPVTIEAWVKTNAIGATDQKIFSKGQTGTNGYAMSIKATTGFLNIGGNGGSNFSGTIAITPNVWHHVVGIIDGVNTKMYVDNVQDSATGTVNVIAGAFSGQIGASQSNAGVVSSYFNGQIDEIAIYDKALTPTEVSARYNAGNGIVAQAGQTLVSSWYDTLDDANNLQKIRWDESSVPAGTQVAFQVQTAPENIGNPGTPSGFVGVDSNGSLDASVYFKNGSYGCVKSGTIVTCTIPANTAISDNINDRWLQYKMILISDGQYTPQVDQVKLDYVINAPPTFVVLDKNQATLQDSDGVLKFNYTATDADQSDFSTNFGVDVGVTTSAINSAATVVPMNGAYANLPSGTHTFMIDREQIVCAVSGSNLVSCTRGNPASAHSAGATLWLLAETKTGAGASKNRDENYQATWNIKQDLPGVYRANARLRVIADDNQLANKISIESGATLTFDLDTKDPNITSIDLKADHSLNADQLTFANAPIDDNAYQIAYLNSYASIVDCQSASYEDFPSGKKKTYSLLADPATVYICVKDAKGNISVASTTTPSVPAGPAVIDVSNFKALPTERRLFTSWKTVPLGGGFGSYKVYRSLDQLVWAPVTTITDRMTNFYMDTAVDQNLEQEYYYKILTTNSRGDVADYSLVAHGKADGIQGDGEGAGGSIPAIISNIVVSDQTTTSAKISWTTDKVSTSTVGFSISQGVFASEQGIGSMDTAHSVVISGLSPGTKYYYQVKSADANNLLVIDNNGGGGYTFSTLDGDVTPPVISSVTTVGVTETTANITWTTNEPADSFVEYSKVDGFAKGSLFGDYAVSTSHDVTITSLESNATYYFKVHSKDSSNNEAISSQGTFTTNASGDITPPDITSINSTPSFNSASVTWSTIADSSTSYVEYGLTNSYGSIYGNGTLTESHVVQLPYDLNAETLYHYRVISRDGAGNEAVSIDKTFTTIANPADVKPPVFSNISIATPSRTSVAITWSTLSDPSTSVVEYSDDGGLSFKQQGTSMLSTSHSVTLVGLSPNTTYIAKLVSVDASGNKGFNDNAGAYYTILTAVGPQLPVVLSHSVSDLTHQGATINWGTDLSSNSFVEYGLDSNYGQVKGDYEMVSNTPGHSVALSNLLPNQTYHYRIRSTAEVEMVSSDYTFLTSQLPDTFPADISEILLDNVSSSSATITWKTNENSNTLLMYGKTVDYTGIAGNKNAVEKNHSATINNLEPNTLYHYQIQTKDELGNVGNGADLTFGTLTDGTLPNVGNVKVLITTQTSAIISWDTDKETSTMIKFSQDESLSNSKIGDMFGKTHYIALDGLDKDRKYNYEIEAIDVYGNKTATNKKDYFTTKPDSSLDHEPLSKIKNISIPEDNKTGTSAVVTFDTAAEVAGEDVSVAASCMIDLTSIKDGKSTVINQKESGWDSESNYNISHAIALSKLDALTDYSFTISCHDNLLKKNVTIENPTIEDKYTIITSVSTFKTKEQTYTQGQIDALGDVVAPVILNVKVSSTSGESATITWDTDEKANSSVRFGIVGIEENSASDSAVNYDKNNFSTAHSVTINGLIPATKYIFVASSTDASGNIGQSSESSFVTASPSSLSSIKAESLNLGEAVITWNTSSETSSTVEYGLSTSYGEKKESSTQAKEHSINLSSLSQGVTYHFRVKGKDQDGKLYSSSDQTFEPKSPPQIKDISNNDVSEHEATVSFQTNVPTTASVEYVNIADPNDNGSQSDNEMATKHAINIKNLSQGSTFKISIKAKDEQGTESQESAKDLTTGKDENPPKIDMVKTDLALTQNDKVQSIISWVTDEQATTSVLYKEGRNAEPKEINVSDSLTTSHVAVLTVFKPGTVYYFNTKSTDASGNSATSSDYALLTPKRRENIIQIIISNFVDIFGWAKI